MCFLTVLCVCKKEIKISRVQSTSQGLHFFMSYDGICSGMMTFSLTRTENDPSSGLLLSITLFEYREVCVRRNGIILDTRAWILSCFRQRHCMKRIFTSSLTTAQLRICTYQQTADTWASNKNYSTSLWNLSPLPHRSQCRWWKARY